MTATLLGALALGLLGSLHCAGMCGPLVLAGATRGGATSTGSLFNYLLGRLCSYAFAGAVLGHIGERALHRLPLPTLQAVLAGVLVAFALWQGYRSLAPSRGPSPFPERTRRSFAVWVARLLPTRGLGLGLATGFLPCGLLVPAWLFAASSSSAARGALTMAAFWAATAPALVAPLLLVRLGRKHRMPTGRWAQGAGWLLLAIWLAVRPLLASSHHH